VEINTTSGNRYAKYSNFTVSNEATNYTLFVDFYYGSATDQLHYHKGMAFSTKDRDNDKTKGSNCAVSYRGAWWYNGCINAHLNGNYGDSAYQWNWSYLKGSEMKLKPGKISLINLPCFTDKR